MERSAAEQVQVYVEDALTRSAIGVEQRPVSRFRKPLVLRDGRCTTDQLADDLLIFHADVVQRRDVPFRHDQHVGWRLRIDVVERENAIVFVDDAGWDFPFDDFAEQAVGHGR